jgi:uncharacterized membrane protein YcaP (DUF421 family)
MDIVLRATFAYVLIVFVLRVMGRRELTSLSAADLILLVVLGDLIQNGVTQSDMSMTGVTIAITTFAVLSIASSYLVFKSRRVRRILQGEPLIIIQDGNPVDRNMRSERLTLDDVMEEARANGIESVDQIKWAVLEAGGKFTFIKNE